MLCNKSDPKHLLTESADFPALTVLTHRKLGYISYRNKVNFVYLVLGSDQNFGSVRGSADFDRFGLVRLGKNLAELLPNFCHSISCSLTIYGYKRTDYGILCSKSFSQSQ